MKTSKGGANISQQSQVLIQNLTIGDQVRWHSDGGVQGERGAEQAAGGGLCHHHLYQYHHTNLQKLNRKLL